MRRNRKGFTLIELMVVIAIIIILAAIAIPNYINMTRMAQVSRASSDAAVLGTALECYRTDHGLYPLTGVAPAGIVVLGTAAPVGYNGGKGPYIDPTALSNITTADKTEESVTYTSGDGTSWVIVIHTKDGQIVTDTNGIIVVT